MLLNREMIIGAQDRKYAEVEVPEWGGTVRLTSLDADTALSQEGVMKRREAGDMKANPLSSLLAASIVDSDGKRLFTDKDMLELGKKNPQVLMRLVAEVRKLNENLDAGDPGNSEGSPVAG